MKRKISKVDIFLVAMLIALVIRKSNTETLVTTAQAIEKLVTEDLIKPEWGQILETPTTREQARNLEKPLKYQKISRTLLIQADLTEIPTTQEAGETDRLSGKDNVFITKTKALPGDLENLVKLGEITQKEAAITKLRLKFNRIESDEYLKETKIRELITNHLQKIKRDNETNLIILGSELTGKVVKRFKCRRNLDIKPIPRILIKKFKDIHKKDLKEEWIHKIRYKGVTIYMKGYKIESRKIDTTFNKILEQYILEKSK